MRPQSRGALSPLPFGSNAGAENQRHAQANSKMMPQHVFLRPLNRVVQVVGKVSAVRTAPFARKALFCTAGALPGAI
jgi:hypothetical protein